METRDAVAEVIHRRFSIVLHGQPEANPYHRAQDDSCYAAADEILELLRSDASNG